MPDYIELTAIDGAHFSHIVDWLISQREKSRARQFALYGLLAA